MVPPQASTVERRKVGTKERIMGGLPLRPGAPLGVSPPMAEGGSSAGPAFTLLVHASCLQEGVAFPRVKRSWVEQSCSLRASPLSLKLNMPSPWAAGGSGGYGHRAGRARLGGIYPGLRSAPD